MDTTGRHEAIPHDTDAEKGYKLSIGRDIIRVVSVFSGTKTASEVIHEAAVKKILFERTVG